MPIEQNRRLDLASLALGVIVGTALTTAVMAVKQDMDSSHSKESGYIPARPIATMASLEIPTREIPIYIAPATTPLAERNIWSVDNNETIAVCGGRRVMIINKMEDPDSLIRQALAAGFNGPDFSVGAVKKGYENAACPQNSTPIPTA